MDEKRAVEVNYYNDLGFYLLNDYCLIETNHGWKNEQREPSSYEIDFFHRCEKQTPEIKQIDARSLYEDRNKVNVNKLLKDEKDTLVWLIEKENVIVLYKKEDDWWSFCTRVYL